AGDLARRRGQGRELDPLVQEEHPAGRRLVRRPPAQTERRVIEMALSYEEPLAKYPVDRAEIDRHKERMLAEVRAYRLRALREQAGVTQAQLAERIGVGQRQVSKIESGDLDNAKIGTIRRYLEAVGGGLAVEYVMGDQRVQVACRRGSVLRRQRDTLLAPTPRLNRLASEQRGLLSIIYGVPDHYGPWWLAPASPVRRSR